ncbi:MULTISPECIES: hypothetical protein [Brevibacillus]|uniref:hypothetical protein n=1 Tax=Brevibacillus TaxID=55080 RepID=UPI000A45F4E5|nr:MULTISPECIES: hypothetical protein [Brevibacillus]MED1917152.1 hypothetical protein [Bacillus thuringiensis]UED73280.1 hypothetical protein HP399_021435 [Brevibacillus sp. DP1.3A]
MRQSKKETFAQGLNRQFLSVDFQDDLEKEMSLQNVEMAQDFHPGLRDIQHPRQKRK